MLCTTAWCTMSGAEELFDQVMARVRESVLLAEEWGVAKAFPNRWCGECFQLEVTFEERINTNAMSTFASLIFSLVNAVWAKDIISCSFNVPFRNWAGSLDRCQPGSMVTCNTDADCADLPTSCCPHYGPGPSPGCNWLRCLSTGAPFAEGTRLCGMHRRAPAGPSTMEGTCEADSLCGIELATGNVGCYANSTCQNPSPMAPKLACYPSGHSAPAVPSKDLIV
eukprot:symbB.v1.2.007975.t1/scaffold465.1/size200768/11